MADSESDDELDSLLLAASQKYEEGYHSDGDCPHDGTSDRDKDDCEAVDSRFGPPVGLSDLDSMVKDAVPKKTRQHTHGVQRRGMNGTPIEEDRRKQNQIGLLY